MVWLLFHIGMFTRIVFTEIRQGHSVLKWLHTPWWNFIFLLSLCVCAKQSNTAQEAITRLHARLWVVKKQFYVVSVIWYGFMVTKTSKFVSGIKDVADNKDFADMESLSEDVNSWTYFSAVCLFQQHSHKHETKQRTTQHAPHPNKQRL